jgi:hypothetical protein
MHHNVSPELSLHRVAVPDGAPPYDDEEADAARPPAYPGAQASGKPGPGGPGSPPPSVQRPGAEGGPGGRPAGTGSWPGQFAQALAETLAGTRPARQLTPWTTEQTRQRIAELGPLLATGQRPRVRRIMTSAPSPGVIELTAVVGFGPRVRVLAVRLERVDSVRGRWRCTAIESA